MFKACAWFCRFLRRRAALAGVRLKAWFSSYGWPLTMAPQMMRSGYDAFRFAESPFAPSHVVSHFPVGPAHGLGGHSEDVGHAVGYFPRFGFVTPSLSHYPNEPLETQYGLWTPPRHAAWTAA